MPGEITIVGIDPGTKQAGLAVVSFDSKGCPRLWKAVCIEGNSRAKNSSTERIERIREIRRQVGNEINNPPCALDIVAYEDPPTQAVGGKAISALAQCVGAILTISQFAYLPVYPIAVQSCKAVFGNAGLQSSRNASDAEKAAKRAAMKTNAILWANTTFPELSLTEKDDAIADALSVCFAAYKIVMRGRRESWQTPLFGEGSRGPRKQKTEVEN